MALSSDASGSADKTLLSQLKDGQACGWRVTGPYRRLGEGLFLAILCGDPVHKKLYDLVDFSEAMNRGGRPINAHIFFARDPRSSSPDHDVVLGDLCIDYMPEAASKILVPDVQFPLSVEKAHVAEVIETIKKGVIRLEFMVQGGGGMIKADLPATFNP